MRYKSLARLRNADRALGGLSRAEPNSVSAKNAKNAKWGPFILLRQSRVLLRIKKKQFRIHIQNNIFVQYRKIALTHYQCQHALQIFNDVPLAQRKTPWVLAQIGKAHYEQAAYSEAEKYFVRIRSMAPSRLGDMEVYGTILWHLKNQVELTYLAHELVEVDRLSPQAWCAIDNSFSLQRDHDQVLKCFKRAVQLDPKFAYAFTLQGHENVANEEYDKALVSYRGAISAENRHYNAWYGLGKVYEKMGKYDVGEQHFRTAAVSTPPTLSCSVALAWLWKR